MAKTIIVSNRLPLQISFKTDSLDVKPSVGGLATGMKSVHKNQESIWIGWTGVVSENTPRNLTKDIDQTLKKEKCIAVDLSKKEIDQFYFGFSNKTIWPLFHYFTEYTEFIEGEWEAYQKVNQKFADVILKNLEDQDTIWIHDYQLLLLPKLIREERPDVPIGFFLHIPFPSFEVFRILPCRNEILEGMLGADLIGFHIFDYERHFFSSVRRLLGYEINFNEINLDKRVVKADSFPMGIDFQKFQSSALKQQQKSIKDKSVVQQELDKHLLMTPDVKLILSIDRLDYTKGIAHRLHAFEYFLKKYPEFIQKTILVMLCVPSRSNVEQYQIMKSEVDELVGRINGQFATIKWTPIWYFYRSVPFENLIDLYTSSEVALLTPIRDGMNLVAKEYIASRIDKKGVLIISEMAGASREMSEALVINPNSMEEIADALKEALLMPEGEQVKRNTVMQKRLERYDIKKWANDFMSSLDNIKKIRDKYTSKRLTPEIKREVYNAYKKSKRRILFLDYDGTLVNFKDKPEDARPDNELVSILDKLNRHTNTKLVLISGRDKATMSEWFSDKDYYLIVEHGVWLKRRNKGWELLEQMNTEWKETIRPILEFYVDRTLGTFLEEKNYSIVWHYRKADPELGSLRAMELKDELTSFVANHDLEILEGNKVIEIKNSGFNKGRAALNLMGNNIYDFILGIGDDWTDEYLFEQLPKKAYTIKVGLKNTQARFNIEAVANVREFLKELAR